MLPLEAASGRHLSVQHVAQFFTWGHLPEHLAEPSRLCAELATAMISALPDGPELVVGLRHLLEAKDAFVRCLVAE